MRIEGKILSNLAVTGVTVALMGRYSKNLQGTLLQGAVAAISSIALPLIYNKSEDKFAGAWKFAAMAVFIAGCLGGLSWKVHLIGTVTLCFLQRYISTSALTQDELVSELKKLNNQTLTKDQFLSALVKFNKLLPSFRSNVLDGVAVDDFIILDAKGIKSLPDNLTFNRGFILNNCTNLVSLPENLTVHGIFYIMGQMRGSATPISMPDKLTVHGTFIISQLAFTSLPNNLTVGGNLSIIDCPSLALFPNNFTLNGSLTLSNCPGLIPFLDNFTFNGNLTLSDFPSLTFFPDNFTVHGRLSIIACTSLVSLSKNLTVGQDLCIIDCPNLTSLSENLTVGQDLCISGCPSLTSLPNRITQLGPIVDGSVRHVCLWNTGLSNEVINHLRQENFPGMQFHFDWDEFRQRFGTYGFESTKAAILFWENLLTQGHGIDQVQLEIKEDHERQYFNLFLFRLKSTAEYKNLNARPYLAQRVVLVMKTMEKDAELATFAISKMNEGLVSCDDGIIHSLDLIEEQILISEAEKTGDPEKLRELGIRFFKLDLMHTKIRKDIIPKMSSDDKVEVDLAFELRLNERLNLPRQTKNMIFRTYARVTDDQIDTVGSQVLNECTNEAIEDYLSRWSPWQMHLRRQEVAKVTYEQLPSVKGVREATCIIKLTTTDQPVVIPGSDGTFDYEALKKRYIECPEHPCSNQVFCWSDVRRVI